MAAPYAIARAIDAFALKVQEAEETGLDRRFPGHTPVERNRIFNPGVTVKPGPKYTRVDVGRSGRFMVVNATGEILGIKAYGVPHFGKRYGTVASPTPEVFRQGAACY